MCGLFAIFSAPGARLPADTEGRVRRALQSIRHRGPDAAGVHVDPESRWAVGHVRLSVIDVDAGSNQPFWSSCGRYMVVFNGEIYNYLELRAELEQAGVRFRTRSDTEVLLQLLIHRGPGAIPKLNGMWSFVFGDVVMGQFIVSRDRWGVKPLYTMSHDGAWIVCSEAKGLFAYAGQTPPPDPRPIGLFLKYSVGGELGSAWFQGVKRFPKASFRQVDLRTFDPDDAIHARYWEYPIQRFPRSVAAAREEMLAVLEDAVRIRLRSDVPVGLSLSGGLDSATIAWLAGGRLGRSLEAYTAWYAPVEKSELPTAQRVAAMFGHRSIAVPEADHDGLLTELSDCVWHLDSGHSSPAIVPYQRLCRAARSSLTVMLEGQGADELLAGYTSFELFAGVDRMLDRRVLEASTCFRSFVATDGWTRLLQELVRYFSRDIYERQALRWGAAELLSSDALSAVPDRMRRIRLSRGNLEEALHLWHEEGLTNLLQYGDAISMSVNLETRCPFLDFRLVELGFSLQTELLVRDGFGKHLLRDLAQNELPRDLVWRRKKEGFTNSTERKLREIVLRDGLPRKGLELAIESGVLKPALLSSEAVKGLPDSVLYRLVTVLLWLERFYAGRC